MCNWNRRRWRLGPNNFFKKNYHLCTSDFVKYWLFHMYVHLWVCTYVYTTHTHMHTLCVHRHTLGTHMRACIHTCTFTQAYMSINRYTMRCMYTHECTHVRAGTRDTCTSLHTHTPVCTCTCMCTKYTNTFARAHLGPCTRWIDNRMHARAHVICAHMRTCMCMYIHHLHKSHVPHPRMPVCLHLP